MFVAETIQILQLVLITGLSLTDNNHVDVSFKDIQYVPEYSTMVLRWVTEVVK